MGRRFAAAAFPHCCAACGAEGSALCGPCEQKIRVRLPGAVFLSGAAAGLDGCGFALPYEDTACRALLHEWKYCGVAEAGRALCRLFAWSLRGAALPAADAVLPLPMHRLRHALRGFNQADALAETAAHAYGVPVLRRTLRRAFRRKRQAEVVSRAARLRNAAGSVCVRRGAAVPTRCVLVDDVFTTGATAAAAAKALRRAGAQEVWALTLFRKA